MPRKSKSRQRLDAIVHPVLLALRKIKIGPIWPSPEDLKDVLPGMRGITRRKTKSPFDQEYRLKRQRKHRQARLSRRKNW